MSAFTQGLNLMLMFESAPASPSGRIEAGQVVGVGVQGMPGDQGSGGEAARFVARKSDGDLAGDAGTLEMPLNLRGAAEKRPLRRDRGLDFEEQNAARCLKIRRFRK